MREGTAIWVQKFGGSTVATPEGRRFLVQRVKDALGAGKKVVAVVSAMGRKGDPYATDTLLSLVEAEGPSDDRERDLLLSSGEIIAAVICAAALRAGGVEAQALTGPQAGIMTDGRFGDAQIIGVDIRRLEELLQKRVVPVVAGFQGLSPDGQVTTLGRGGSDTTAAALGVALQAEVVEIYTDVPGIQTADPSLVPEAVLLPEVTYDEVFQLAHGGGKVVHPRAVELLMRAGIPIRVRRARDTEGGTWVVRERQGQDPWGTYGRPVTFVTQKPHLVLVEVEGDLWDQARAFRAVADAGISVDLIHIHRRGQSFTVPEEVAEKVEEALLRAGFSPRMEGGLAKVTVVGSGMHGRPGVAAAVVEALAEKGIPILAAADSHVTVSCLVPGEAMAEAVRALHRRFGLAEEETKAWERGQGYVGEGRLGGPGHSL
ncbi:MAG: aspartate kinase [Clostridiales bacterium]|nr:aspartate kinase [Clostridiales bacterium]